SFFLVLLRPHPISTLFPYTTLFRSHQCEISARTWWAFGYVSLFSQFIGFFAWYAGLAMGGIARVSQIQLLQIFFTIAFSALFFGDRKSTRLNSSHLGISYAVFCLKK